MASAHPFRNKYGFPRVIAKKMSGKTTRPWIAIPTTTVTINKPRLENVPPISFISANRAMIKLIMPMGEYLKERNNNKNERYHNLFPIKKKIILKRFAVQKSQLLFLRNLSTGFPCNINRGINHSQKVHTRFLFLA